MKATIWIVCGTVLLIAASAPGCSDAKSQSGDVPSFDADGLDGGDMGVDQDEADGIVADGGDELQDRDGLDGGDLLDAEDGADGGGDERCAAYRFEPRVPPGGPVDCSPIEQDPDFALCTSEVDHCEGVASGGRGCEALCASAGLTCVVAYQADPSRDCHRSGIKPCDRVGASDYCWCAPIEDPPFEMDPGYCNSGSVALFDPYVTDVLTPWPSNLYTRTDPESATCIWLDFGPDRVPDHEWDFVTYPAVREQLERLDGFGTSAKIAFMTNCEMENSLFDPDAITKITPEDTTKPDAPLLLINMDESSPYRGQPQRILVTYEEDRVTEGGLILMHPTVPLRPGTKYAAILTTRLKTESGDCFGPSPMTARLLMGRARGPGLERIQRDIDPLFDLLFQNGFQIEKKDVAGLTVFTTMDVRRGMLHAAKEVLRTTAENPPTILPGSLSWEAVGSNEIAWKVTGSFESITFRNPATGLFEYGPDGLPVVVGTHEVKFLLQIPMTPGPDQGGPPYRAFVYHHGLGGDREESNSASQRLAGAHGGTPRGWATGSIDTIHHGDRCTKEPICAPGECEPCVWGPAGDLTAIFHFFAVEMEGKSFNMELARDNFRQDYIDWLVFLRLLTHPDGLDVLPAGAPDGVPDILDDKVGYTSLSLGGVMSGAIVPLSPDIEVAMINVGGGGVTDILLDSTIFRTFVEVLKAPGMRDYDIRRFFPVIQTIIDPADPVNYAAGMFFEPFEELGCGQKSVLFQMVENDLYIPNLCNESLGRAASTRQVGDVYHEVPDMPHGGPLPVSGNLPAGLHTTGYFQFHHNCTESGFPLLPFNHGDMFSSAVGTRQWRHFFESFYLNGVAEIVDPYLPPLDCRW